MGSVVVEELQYWQQLLLEARPIEKIIKKGIVFKKLSKKFLFFFLFLFFACLQWSCEHQALPTMRLRRVTKSFKPRRHLCRWRTNQGLAAKIATTWLKWHQSSKRHCGQDWQHSFWMQFPNRPRKCENLMINKLETITFLQTLYVWPLIVP